MSNGSSAAANSDFSKRCFTRFDVTYCAAASRCGNSDYTLGRYLAHGRRGSVFAARRRHTPDDGTLAAKVMPIHVPVPFDDKGARIVSGAMPLAHFEREARIARQMGEAGVGPRVHASWTCAMKRPSEPLGARQNDRDAPMLGFIVLDRWDVTLKQYAAAHRDLAQRHAAALYATLSAKLERMHALGYNHKDVIPSNVMLRLHASTHEPVDAAVVDFSNVGEVGTPSQGHVDGRERLCKAFRELRLPVVVADVASSSCVDARLGLPSQSAAAPANGCRHAAPAPAVTVDAAAAAAPKAPVPAPTTVTPPTVVVADMHAPTSTVTPPPAAADMHVTPVADDHKVAPLPVPAPNRDVDTSAHEVTKAAKAAAKKSKRRSTPDTPDAATVQSSSAAAMTRVPLRHGWSRAPSQFLVQRHRALMASWPRSHRIDKQ